MFPPRQFTHKGLIPPIRRAAPIPVALSMILLAASATPSCAAPAKPALGPNVLVFDPSMPAADIQAQIDKVYAVQQHSEFGSARYAFSSFPANIKSTFPSASTPKSSAWAPSPDTVHITGNVHADASLPRNNATCTFWRAVEGFSVTPTGGATSAPCSGPSPRPCPSAACTFCGNIVLHQKRGWASGGWMSDSLVDGNVDSGPQQQWISRNSEWGSWTGANWNMVFVGIPNPPAGDWPTPPYTKVAHTPIVREKPFLEVDARGNWSVSASPHSRTNSSGITWHGGSTPGTIHPAQPVLHRPSRADTAATINTQLAEGKNLLLHARHLRPRRAHPRHPPRHRRPGPRLRHARPVNGTAAITTADADGIIVAGLLIDAGPEQSPVLFEIGPQGSQASHASNPISLHDIFFRVGGAGVGRAKVNLEINSNDTIVDHTWIWRADHGYGVGWNQNLSDNGLVVNGNNVTVYGLFVEHHQQFQVLWNGNGGRTYFYQSEIPYDPPDQTSFTSRAGSQRLGLLQSGRQRHHPRSLGPRRLLGLPPSQRHAHPRHRSPRSPSVRFHHMITVALDNLGEISNVIDNTGGATVTKPRVTPKLAEFP